MTLASSKTVATSVAGSWIDGAPVVTGGGLFQVINPATGEAVADYALATQTDVDRAVASARKALPGWATATPVDRSAVLAKLAKLADDHADDLVAEEVSQTGKPVRLATEFDVPGSVDNIDFFAGAARHLEGKATAEYSGDHTSSIRREAVGVAESSDVPACGGQELGAEDNAEAGHAQDNFGVAVSAKSLLDHRVGVADFGVEGHHLLGQPSHHRRRQLLAGYHGVLGFGRFDRRGCYGIGVAGLAFTQPGR